MFEKSNLNVTLSLLLLIGLLVLCNLAKYLNIDLLSWSTSEFTDTPYCPGQHPKIPCAMVKKCPNTVDRVSSSDREAIDRYLYLSGLFEATKLLDGKEDKWWN